METGKLAFEIEQTVNGAYEEFVGLAEDKIKKRPAENEWSIKEIIGHLLDSASNNHQRWVRLQLADGLSFPGYQHENEQWVAIQKYNDRPWEALLNLWRCFNLHLAAIIRDVCPECLQNIWVVDEDTVIMLNELMTGYLRHLKDHLDQIRFRIN